jgi:hypothetical protein
MPDIYELILSGPVSLGDIVHSKLFILTPLWFYGVPSTTFFFREGRAARAGAHNIVICPDKHRYCQSSDYGEDKGTLCVISYGE